MVIGLLVHPPILTSLSYLLHVVFYVGLPRPRPK
jgi:hypothetical protein